jgi:hypothetical protein
MIDFLQFSTYIFEFDDLHALNVLIFCPQTMPLLNS